MWLISEDVITDDSMSLTASNAEEWGGSGGEPEVLPPSQTPRPDAELIRVLSKVVEDLGLEWSAQEEPSHGLLDEWYLLGSHQQSSRQRPAPFLLAVYLIFKKYYFHICGLSRTRHQQ